MRAALVAVAATLVAAVLAAPALAASPYAPLDRPGPRLDVPARTLAASVHCSSRVRRDGREPILLVPGTTLTPQANFSWNYERAFDALGLPYCTVELPQNANGDVQVAGEYVVYAIRHLHAITRRKVQILGYSQGGMVPRWALRFWPDTRRLVDDDIGLDASNHGTDSAAWCSGSLQCPPAFWQRRSDAAFIAALNSRQETFRGISYTEIYSYTDEVVTPNVGPSPSSAVGIGGGRITNVAVQSICPNDTSDHLAMGSYDAVSYALALDAITHRGPADPGRISPAVCTQPFQPGVNPATFASDYAGYLAFIGQSVANAPKVGAEPPLRCYVTARGCPKPKPKPRRHAAPRRAGRRPPRRPARAGRDRR